MLDQLVHVLTVQRCTGVRKFQHEPDTIEMFMNMTVLIVFQCINIHSFCGPLARMVNICSIPRVSNNIRDFPRSRTLDCFSFV